MTAGTAFEWDDGNREKCQKHGLALSDIEYVLEHNGSAIMPASPGVETRFIAIGRTPSGRVAFVVFTTREDSAGVRLRPISARYMHPREVRKYGQALAALQKR